MRWWFFCLSILGFLSCAPAIADGENKVPKNERVARALKDGLKFPADKIKEIAAAGGIRIEAMSGIKPDAAEVGIATKRTRHWISIAALACVSAPLIGIRPGGNTCSHEEAPMRISRGIAVSLTVIFGLSIAIRAEAYSLRQTPQGKLYLWKKLALTYKLEVTDLPTGITQAQVEDALTGVKNTVEGVSHGTGSNSKQFTLSSTTQSPDIQVRFAAADATYPGTNERIFPNNTTNGTSQPTVSQATGEITGTTIYINRDRPWTTQGSELGKLDLQSVLLHETTHALGNGHAMGKTSGGTVVELSWDTALDAEGRSSAMSTEFTTNNSFRVYNQKDLIDLKEVIKKTSEAVAGSSVSGLGIRSAGVQTVGNLQQWTYALGNDTETVLTLADLGVQVRSPSTQFAFASTTLVPVSTESSDEDGTLFTFAPFTILPHTELGFSLEYDLGVVQPQLSEAYMCFNDAVYGLEWIAGSSLIGPSTIPVPEPAALGLCGLGVLARLSIRRGRSSKR